MNTQLLELYRKNRKKDYITARCAYQWAKNEIHNSEFDIEFEDCRYSGEHKPISKATVEYNGFTFLVSVYSDYFEHDESDFVFNETWGYFKNMYSKHNAWLKAKECEQQNKDYLEKLERGDFYCYYIKVEVQNFEFIEESLGGIICDGSDFIKEASIELIDQCMYSLNEELVAEKQYLQMV